MHLNQLQNTHLWRHFTYIRISERLEAPIASIDTSKSASTKQEQIEPVKAVQVSQNVVIRKQNHLYL